MKKLGFILPASILLALCLGSCKEKQPESLRPITTEIDGKLGEMYELVEEDYVFPTISNQLEIKVKRNDNSGHGYSKIGVGYEIYDENGNVIESEINPALEDISAWSAIPFSVMELKPGEIGTMYINLKGWPDKLGGAKTFKLILESNVNESESSSDNIELNNSDLDVMLDSYEELVNEYDKFLSEMKSGNVDSQSAMNAVAKAQKMQEKLDACKSDMNSKQIQRLGKITTRLTQIASKAATINPDDIKSVNGVDLKDLGL